jgi:hypothetical protein
MAFMTICFEHHFSDEQTATPRSRVAQGHKDHWNQDRIVFQVDLGLSALRLLILSEADHTRTLLLDLVVF